MSDLMLLGVLGMPLPDDPAEVDPMMWHQLKGRLHEAATRIERGVQCSMVLFHATTPKKVRSYHQSCRIIAPVRGFTTIPAAMAWACKTGRSVILAVNGRACHKLPDHHNAFGEAWWIDHDVTEWKCVFSPKDA